MQRKSLSRPVMPLPHPPASNARLQNYGNGKMTDDVHHVGSVMFGARGQSREIVPKGVQTCYRLRHTCSTLSEPARVSRVFGWVGFKGA